MHYNHAFCSRDNHKRPKVDSPVEEISETRLVFEAQPVNQGFMVDFNKILHNGKP